MKEKKEKVFLGITVTKTVKDKLVLLSKKERRSVSAQASLIIEEELKKKE